MLFYERKKSQHHIQEIAKLKPELNKFKVGMSTLLSSPSPS